METLCEMFAKFSTSTSDSTNQTFKPQLEKVGCIKPIKYQIMKNIFNSDDRMQNLMLTKRQIGFISHKFIRSEIVSARSFFRKLLSRNPNLEFMNSSIIDVFNVAKRINHIPRAKKLGITEGFAIINFTIQPFRVNLKFSIEFLNQVAQLFEAYLYHIKKSICSRMEGFEEDEPINMDMLLLDLHGDGLFKTVQVK